jgi:hypothetical protein
VSLKMTMRGVLIFQLNRGVCSLPLNGL